MVAMLSRWNAGSVDNNDLLAGRPVARCEFFGVRNNDANDTLNAEATKKKIWKKKTQKINGNKKLKPVGQTTVAYLAWRREQSKHTIYSHECHTSVCLCVYKWKNYCQKKARKKW